MYHVIITTRKIGLHFVTTDSYHSFEGGLA